MQSLLKKVVESLNSTIFTPLQEAFTFRLKNIFFGSFTFSWVIINWDKIAYFFLTKDDIMIRIYRVKNNFDENFTFSYLNFENARNFAAPLTIALIAGLTYPIFTLLSKWLFQRITLAIDLIDIDKETIRQKRQLELNKAVADNFMAQEVIKARDSAYLEEAREKAALSKSRIAELKQSTINLESSVTENEIKLKSLAERKNATQSELDHLAKNLTDIQKLHGDYSSLLKSYESLKEDFNSISASQEERWQQMKSNTMQLDNIKQDIMRVRNELPFIFDGMDTEFSLALNHDWKKYIEETQRRQQKLGNAGPPHIRL